MKQEVGAVESNIHFLEKVDGSASTKKVTVTPNKGMMCLIVMMTSYGWGFSGLLYPDTPSYCQIHANVNGSITSPQVKWTYSTGEIAMVSTESWCGIQRVIVIG